MRVTSSATYCKTYLPKILLAAGGNFVFKNYFINLETDFSDQYKSIYSKSRWWPPVVGLVLQLTANSATTFS